MQKTTFPYEIIIADDCSTDGTSAICAEYAAKYPNKTRHLRGEYNVGGVEKERRAIEAAQGEYVALCEGDDYWTDPYKLQKEVDILDNDPNVMLVYTGFNNVDENGKLFYRADYEYLMKLSKSGEMFGSELEKNRIMTLTTCLRREVLFSELYQNCPLKYDLTFSLTASLMGKLVYLPDRTGCYRMNPDSLMNAHWDKIRNHFHQIGEYFAYAYLDVPHKRFSFVQDLSIITTIIHKNMCNRALMNRLFRKKPLSIILYPFIRLYYHFV
jgi:glycosyltransferase involved in cell wall biosynthesis